MARQGKCHGGTCLQLDVAYLKARLASATHSESEPPEAGDQIAAAVLVPLVVRPHGLQVLLTKRTAHLNHHPGQISFPGGRIEADDVSPTAAALRETEEETGLAPALIELLGELPAFDTSTGFRISPVVGIVRPPFELTPDPFEVAEVFEVPLSFLLDRANHQRHEIVWRGRVRHYWAMPWGDYYIWGATAGIILSLAHALAPQA